MDIRGKWYDRGGVKLLLAFLLNAVFLALMLACFVPIFETNDDVLMSKFVDGQLSHKSAYVPFINICLGWLLKMLYTVGGDDFNWYSACQYAVLYLGFTAITWTLLRRFRPLPALTMTVVLLSAFAVDCYLSMNFSKPSAVGTVGGLCLMLYSLKNETGGVLRRPLALGIALTLLGFVWRYEEFFVCAAIMAGIGLLALADVGCESRGRPLRERAAPMLRLAAPFALLLALVAGLYGVNYLAWNNDEYKAYTDFDWTRSMVIDFGFVPYAEMPEAYDALGMDETAVKVLKNWNFYDTEKFTQESLQGILDAREGLVARRSIGECLGVFLDKCVGGFFIDRPVAGFVFMLLFFLVCGRRGARDWLTAAWLLGSFFAIYMALIYTDRYLANRVDIGLFLAMAVGFSFLLDGRRLEDERLFCVFVLTLSLFIGYRSCRKVCIYDSHSEIDYKADKRAAVDAVLRDTEHLYFVTFLSIDHEIYGPLETAPAGYADRIVFMGNWSCRHPETERVLARWGVTNPYRDIIGSDQLYIIDSNIDETMTYINEYYDPDASAEPVEPMSSQTGLEIYRILE